MPKREEAKEVAIAPFPPLMQSKDEWQGEMAVPAWAGFQSRGGSYAAQDDEAPSRGMVSVSITRQGGAAAPSSEQVAAYQHLLARGEVVTQAILRAVFEKYAGWKEDLGEDVEEEMMPDIKSPEELRKLMGPGSAYILTQARDGVAYIGIEFGCNWDDEHGLGVLIHKDRVVEMGDYGFAQQAENDLNPPPPPPADPHELMLEGRYPEAQVRAVEEIKLYSQFDGRFPGGMTKRAIRINATACLILGRKEEGLQGFQHLNNVEMQQKSKSMVEAGLDDAFGISELRDLGVAQWCAGKHAEAIATFQILVDGVTNGTLKKRLDGARVWQGLLLFHAALFAGDKSSLDHARQFLESRLTDKQIKDWPGPLAQMLCGKKSPEDVFKAKFKKPEAEVEAKARTMNGITTRREYAIYLTHAASHAMDKGDKAGAEALLARCAGLPYAMEGEWLLAKCFVK